VDRLPGGEEWLRLGQAFGDVDALAVQREMIRRTIKEHFDKKKRLAPQGIKVLSLFFIEEVARYRQYDADGSPVKGAYAGIFEEEYRRLAGHPDHRSLFEGVDAAQAAHDGYFSIDKKGGWADTAENNQTNRESAERETSAPITLQEADIELPDLLTELQDRTQLTRRTIYRVLTGCDRLDDFKRNPQAFIERAGEAINRCKRLAVVDGIKCQRLGDEHYDAQELFEQEELTGYLKNLLDATKAVYEQVVYDSGIEAQFADGLEKNEAIKVYAKLPGWFTVPTPLGGYHPDWAVLVERDGAERLYLVVETKGSLFLDDLRDAEAAKIRCGKAHFEALAVEEAPARYLVARSLDDLLAGS